MPSVENAVGRVQGSGPPHYSGIRFGIRFRVPIRSHPINIAESPEYGRPPPRGWIPNRARFGGFPDPIRSDQSDQVLAGWRGPGFFRDGRHVSGYGPESGRAARAVRGRCGRLRAALWRLRAAPPGLHGKRLCFRCIVATRRFPGRYASAAYTPVCGGTTGNMPRIPGGPGRERVCDRGHTAWSTSEQSNSSHLHGPP